MAKEYACSFYGHGIFLPENLRITLFTVSLICSDANQLNSTIVLCKPNVNVYPRVMKLYPGKSIGRISSSEL
jgi:hypothetical protein